MGWLQVCTAAVFVRTLHERGQRPAGVALVWSGVPALSDFAPFADVAWKLFTRTLFKMGAFASISTVAMGLPFKAAATHQVPQHRRSPPPPTRLSCTGVSRSPRISPQRSHEAKPRLVTHTCRPGLVTQAAGDATHAQCSSMHALPYGGACRW